jgi:hypothetical protein
MTKVLRWLVFGAAVSVLPLLYAFFDLKFNGHTPTWLQIVGGGELLVVTWVLAASALGELFGGSDKYPKTKIVFGGTTFLMIVAAALFFSSIAVAKANKVTLNEDYVVTVSLSLFVISLVPCCICLLFSED